MNFWGMRTSLRIVAITQARMGSTRLPGKVLMDIGGETMLARVINRTLRAKSLAMVVVATTTLEQDDVILDHVGRLGIDTFRGDEEDVLSRYYEAAKFFDAEVIVRITSDCPLIEPEIIDNVVLAFLNVYPAVDYASNTLQRTYPEGLDVEVVSFAALKRAWHEATETYQRVHVMPYIYESPDLFHLLSVTGEVDYSGYRWTVDTLEDLEFVRAVYAALNNNDTFTWHDVLKLLAEKPKLVELNRHVQQKPLKEC